MTFDLVWGFVLGVLTAVSAKSALAFIRMKRRHWKDDDE